MRKIYDGIIGLVVGDALGVPVEFKNRDTFEVNDMIGYGTYNQPPGTWSDDSSMTLATLESIGWLGKVDPADIMENFKRWFQYAEFTPYGKVFDIGGATQGAICRYMRGTPYNECGGKSVMDNGNGALMRILPVAMLPNSADKQIEVLRVAHLTHAHFISDFACLVYTAIVENLILGMEKEKAVFEGIPTRFQYYTILADYSRLPNIQQLKRDEIKSSGYVVDTLEAALWCFLNTDSYRDCVLTAVNLGEDTDTVAAVAGGLAGIHYGCGGIKGIPDEWILQIARKDWIKRLCEGVDR